MIKIKYIQIYKEVKTFFIEKSTITMIFLKSDLLLLTKKSYIEVDR